MAFTADSTFNKTLVNLSKMKIVKKIKSINELWDKLKWPNI